MIDLKCIIHVMSSCNQPFDNAQSNISTHDSSSPSLIGVVDVVVSFLRAFEWDFGTKKVKSSLNISLMNNSCPIDVVVVMNLIHRSMPLQIMRKTKDSACEFRNNRKLFLDMQDQIGVKSKYTVRSMEKTISFLHGEEMSVIEKIWFLSIPIILADTIVNTTIYSQCHHQHLPRIEWLSQSVIKFWSIAIESVSHVRCIIWYFWETLTRLDSSNSTVN